MDRDPSSEIVTGGVHTSSIFIYILSNIACSRVTTLTTLNLFDFGINILNTLHGLIASNYYGTGATAKRKQINMLRVIIHASSKYQ